MDIVSSSVQDGSEEIESFSMPLRERLRSFFLLPPKVDENPLQSINLEARKLLGLYEKSIEKRHEASEWLASKHDEFRELRSTLPDQQLALKLREYMKLTYKIKNMETANLLQKLQSCDNINEIPSIVFEIIKTAPRPLPTQLKLRKLLTTITQEKAAAIMKLFHAEFSKQLEDSNTLEVIDNEENNILQNSWETFFQSAGKWLLAISVLQMAATAVGEARNVSKVPGNQQAAANVSSSCVDVYSVVLDDALTPLWGRFYFHLSTARQTKSTKQYLWTFKYAQSFLELMLELVKEIGISSDLKENFVGDFYSAGKTYITDKVIKFMKSHVSYMLSDMMSDSPTGVLIDEEALEIVEHCLQFDSFVHSQILQIDDANNANINQLSLSSVIYDIKPILAAWIDADRQYVLDRLWSDIDESNPLENLYIAEFSSKLLDDSNIFDCTIPYSGFRCYRALYDCLSLFSTFCMRYEYLGPQAQDMFAEAVLEPLLLLSVSLLVYRIRTSIQLASQAKKASKKGDKSADDTNYINATENDRNTLLTLSEYTTSCYYFQSCLSEINSSQRMLSLTPTRFQEKWAAIHATLPRRLISPLGVRTGRFSFKSLFFRCFSKDPNSFEDADNKQIDELFTSEAIVSVSRPLRLPGTLGEVIDITRSQVIAVSSVLENSA